MVWRISKSVIFGRKEDTESLVAHYSSELGNGGRGCRRSIRNGEKIIADQGLSEPMVELVDGDVVGESNWVKLNRLFDEFERGLSKQEKAETRRLLRGRK